MLLNDFFFIQRIEKGDTSLKAFLSIDKNHKIFDGHFPTIPIVPGVCMMQMMKEIMEDQLNNKFIIREGDNIKFLAVINPTEHSEIEADIQYEQGQEGIRISGTLFSGSLIFFKIKATLQVA